METIIINIDKTDASDDLHNKLVSLMKDDFKNDPVPGHMVYKLTRLHKDECPTDDAHYIFGISPSQMKNKLIQSS